MDVKVIRSLSPPPYTDADVCTQPIRPTRSSRARQDENHVALQQKSTSGVAAVAAKAEKTAGGLKAAARRTAFADVSNKVQPSRATTAAGKDGKGGVIIIQDADSQKPSRPAQRISGAQKAITATTTITTTSATIIQQAGPRRPTRRTTVYEDKKPASPRRKSPKKASPKVSRDAVAKRGELQAAVTRQNGLRHPPPQRPISRVKQQAVKDDGPVYSDQPHLFDHHNNNDVDDDEDEEEEEEEEEQEDDDDDDEEEEDDDGDDDDDDDDDEDYAEANQDGRDAASVEDDDRKPRLHDKARFHADVEAVSDYESDEGDDDHESSDYTRGGLAAGARSRHGDNTTGVTTQVMVPKWTSKARNEISRLNQHYAALQDEDEEADISMVAEYGDDIFAYMRELEVGHSYILHGCFG